MPGACCTRDLVCNKCEECAHEHTGTAGALRHSLRNGFTAYIVLSPVGPGSLSPSPAELLPPTWRQHRGVRTTRLRRTRYLHTSVAALASIASHRAFV